MNEHIDLTKESHGLINFSPLGDPYYQWVPVYNDPDEPGKIIVEYPAIDSCYGLGVNQTATWIMEYLTQLPNRGVIMFAVLDKGLGGAGHPHPYEDPSDIESHPVETIACWSDLLGISPHLHQIDWQLDKFRTSGASAALKVMLKSLAQPSALGSPANPLAGEDVVLASNDGVVRVIDWPRFFHSSLPPDRYVLSVRRFYQYIAECCQRAFESTSQEFPLISVIASGYRLQLVEAPMQRSRCVIRARIEPTGKKRKSADAKLLYEEEFSVNHEICERPIFHAFLPPQLQMNTAFVAAYKIEEWLHGRGIDRGQVTARETERAKSTNRVFITQGAFLHPGSGNYNHFNPDFFADMARKLETHMRAQLELPNISFVFEFDEKIDLKERGFRDSIPSTESVIYRIKRVVVTGSGTQKTKIDIDFSGKSS